MADENILPRDQNHVTAAGFENSLAAGDVRPGQIIVATGRIKVDNAGGGSGDVSGPGSSTDNAVVRWDGTTGQLVQDSVVIMDDSGNMSGVGTFTASGLVRSATGIAVEGTGAGTDIITIQAPSSIAASYTLTLPVDDGNNGEFLTTNGSGVLSWTTPSGGGDVTGPGSSTDNAIARFDGTTGKIIQNSAVTIADTTGVISGTQGIVFTGSSSGTTTLQPTAAASGTLTLPAATDTLIGKATTDTLTNKTYDTAGTGNSFLINGVAVTANTGTGAVARASSPTFVTPTLGAATATSINGLTITSSTGTLTITNAKTLSVSNSMTFTATDGSTVAFGAGGTVLYTSSTIPLTVGTTTITSGTNTRILYNNSGVLGEYAVTGSGTTAVLSTSPTFTTSIITPLIVGGTGTTGTQLTIKTTSGNGTTDQMVFVGGNNGATTFATLKENSLDLGTSAALGTGTIELGAASDTTLSRSAAGVLAVEGVVIPSISSSNTITNKRNQPRTASSTTSSNLSPDLSSANVYYRTTQTATLTIDAPTGTPVIGEVIAIYVDSAGAQTLTINSTYKAFGTAFPSTTTAGKTFMMIAQYNGTDWKTTWANAV